MFLILPDIDCECQHTDPEGGAYKEQGCVKQNLDRKARVICSISKALEIG